ncbi:MAG: hypothetical protein CVU09_05210 [Bacteroidetes bacterium HGW-Bacteroidetes-4]|jgi:hypothetical protein|nr:MAG: hypothetical protein CVU09_05210 [Bacteroidetes bacterium HGW-Bacteroidetes-4]
MLSKTKYILVIALTVFLVACSDDFLENNPIALDTTESFYTSFESLDYTATSAYGMLASMSVFDIMYSIGYQSASDDVEVGGENINDWPEFQRIDRLTHTPSEANIHIMWGYPYKGIRMANEYLTRYEAVKEIEVKKAKSEADAQARLELMNLRAAEMHFMRAFYHFTLLQIYGGVPIIDFIVDPEQFNVPRNKIAEVLHFIQDELLLAIPILKLKSEQGADVGRVTKGSAQALLAKAYLYESSYAENYSGDERFEGCEQHYDLALGYAEDVITSGEYGLVGIGGERFDSWRAPLGGQIGAYRWIFTLDGDNCDESVWEIQNVQDRAGWCYTRGSYITIYTTVRKLFINDSTLSTDYGWSFNLPSKYLIEAFGNSDTRETGLNSLAVDPALDPRFSTTIGREGDTLLANMNGSKKWYKMAFSNLPTGTISRKYECSPDDFTFGANDTYGEGPMNIRLIRYADVVLMAAEAAYKSGDAPKALGYVNQVRTRARLSGETGYPEDLPAITFEDIVHERRLELAMEPHRLFDLVRWNLAEKYMNGITLASMGEGLVVNFEKGKHEFFPIPAREMQKATGLVQYNGWK